MIDTNSAEIVNATADNFDQLIKDGKVVVDFWAEWCGPCKMIAPMVEELANKYKGEIKFIKLDTDAYPEISQRFNIFSIPNVYFFENGEVKGNQVGAYPQPVFEKNILSAYGMGDRNISM